MEKSNTTLPKNKKGENSNFITNHKYIVASEKKVAAGINAIYHLIKEENFRAKRTIDSDGIQGIDTLYLTEDELKTHNLISYFPNNGKNGITVHIHKFGYIAYPPLFYMLKQKLKSFAIAANLNKTEFTKIWKEIIKIYQHKFTQGLYGKKLIAAPQEHNVKIFHQFAVEAMDELSKLMMIMVYESHISPAKQGEVHFKEFVNDILCKAATLRTSKASILTFDENVKIFSLDEIYSEVASHRRGLLDKLANLSIIYEGNYFNDKFNVTHSYLKHALLSPIDAIPEKPLSSLFEEDIDVIITTCNNIELIANVMATYLKHGCSLDEQVPVQIDWTYQLLMTNAISNEKHATLYAYVIKSSNMMNKIQLGNINLTLHVINAGVNDWAEYNFGHHSDIQLRENINAYLHLTNSFNQHLQPILTHAGDIDHTYINIFNKLIMYYESIELIVIDPKRIDKLLELHQEVYSEREMANLKKEYADKIATIESLLTLKSQYKNELSILANKFNTSRLRYNAIFEEHAKMLQQNGSHVEKNSDKMNFLREEFDNEKIKIKKLLKESGSLSLKLEKINKRLLSYSQECWDLNKNYIQNHIHLLMNDSSLVLLFQNLNHTQADIRSRAEACLLNMIAVIYKSYLDELFYSNRYKEPKNGALFNAYLSSYLRINGLMSSIGGKCGNNRSYIVRLFLAALNKHDNRHFLPLSLHRDLECYKHLCVDFAKMKISNSAIYSSIVDLAGGTPKVDSKKFKYLYFVEGINYIGEFAKYASFKVFESITNALHKRKDKNPDNKFVTAYKNYKIRNNIYNAD